MKKQLIFSGNYFVGKEKDIILEACLGSCVGVTIWDKEAKVGGLIHLLLPEWTGYGEILKPALYAKTGLPLFINALIEAGADKSRMKAYVAGGALIGPISQLDMDLNIGGRTADIVQKILTDESIEVCQAETGGFFGYRLNIDLRSFKSSINLIVDMPSHEDNDFKKPVPADIIQSINVVRPIPQIILKVVQMINDGNYNINEVAKDIKKEQVISAAILRLCASSYLGLKEKVTSISRALALLGEKNLFKVIVSASLELYFSDAAKGYSLCKGGLFHHALGTAIISEELAKYTGIAKPEIAYTAGLLHDIGKVVLDQYISSAYPLFYRRTQIDMAELDKVEKELTGITHSEAGAIIAERWSINESLIDVIRHHHQPELASKAPELTHIVYLADLLMSKFQAGQELATLDKGDISSRLNKIGLATSKFPVIVNLIPQSILEGTINLPAFSQ
ncbi:MAG: HDOD domain-containing protein [Pseudomonadota bacterium]